MKSTLDQAKQVLNLFSQKNLSEEELQKLFSSGLLSDILDCDPEKVNRGHLQKLLRGELAVSEPARRWREEDGVIYFSVASDGTTGPQWVTRLEKQNFQVGNYAKSILCSSDFKPTTGVKYEIVVLKGMLFSDDNRITKKIRAKAKKRKLTVPNAEVTCLIREAFSDEELEAMGLWWIITMHEPIKVSDGRPFLLGAGGDYGGRWLGACCDGPGDRWDRGDGFAFVVSQVGA